MSDRHGSRRPPGKGGPRRKRVPPPDGTGRERGWLQERVDAGASVSVRLADGEQLEGTVEAFDGDVLVVRPPGSPAIQLRKRDVRYIVGLDEG